MGREPERIREDVFRLSQLHDLKYEVDEISQRIARLDREMYGTENRAPGASAMLNGSIRDQMEMRRRSCMEELGALYDYIDSIPESLLRRVFSLRYIDALSWQKVAFRLGETDEQYPRRMHQRYLADHPLP